MTYSYLHISIGYAQLGQDPKVLEPVMGQLAEDWARYNFNAWVLWTDKSPLTCMEMIKAKLSGADQLLVLKLDLSATPMGSLPAWLWEWFNRPRDPVSGYVQLTPATHSGLPPSSLSPDLFNPLAPRAAAGSNVLKALLGSVAPPAPPKENALRNAFGIPDRPAPPMLTPDGNPLRDALGLPTKPDANRLLGDPTNAPRKPKP